MKKLAMMYLAIGLTGAFAATGSFKVTLSQDSIVEGKQVKAGDYKITVENGNAMLKQGKEVIEVPAHEEAQANKYAQTSVTLKDNTTLQEIRVGGTHTKIVFGQATSSASGM